MCGINEQAWKSRVMRFYSWVFIWHRHCIRSVCLAQMQEGRAISTLTDAAKLLWRGCATVSSCQQCMRMNSFHLTALWIITSISREALNHPSTCLTDNSRAASCTKAFLKPSHFLTLSNISDAKIKSGARSTLLHICLRNHLHYLPLMRPKALQGKRSPALCFQYLFSIAPGTEVFWKHGTNWHLHLWH